MNFVEKVLTYAKGGDEAKIVKFKSDVEKYLKRQIKEIKDENDDFKDKLADKQDELNEAVVNVNLDRIKTTDDRKAYIEEYIDTLESKERRIRELNKKIEANKLLLALRESQIVLVD